MDTTTRQYFLNACSTGGEADVARLLKDWENADTIHSTSHSDLLQAGLIKATECGQASVVRILIDKGACISPHVITAASTSGSTSVFQAMIDSGWNINQPASLTGDALRCDPVHLCQDIGDNWLLEHGADPNCNHRAGMWSVLDLAVIHASPAVVKLLIDGGAQIKNTNALLNAVRCGKLDMISILLDHGADPDEVPDHDLTSDHDRKEGLVSAFDLAKQEGKEEIVHYLTERRNTNLSYVRV